MGSKHIIKLGSIMNFFKDEEKLISKGENAVESHHVTNMVFDSDHHILKGKVQASMRDRHYNVEVDFETDWTIKSGLCSCPRGQFQCHHMAALLLFARDNISVTDKECAWNQMKVSKDAEVKKIKDLYPTKDYRATDRNLTEEEIVAFRDKLSMFDGAVGFSWILADEVNQEREIFIPDIEEILYSESYITAENKQEFLENRLAISQDDVSKIVLETAGQAANPKWLLARKNRLTASNFSVVLSACRRKRFPPSLFKRLSGSYDLDHIKAIQWGKLHEKEALKSLEDSLGVQVLPTGFWIDECGYIGASPDGLIGDTNIVEVKCPYKYREDSLLEAIKTSHDYIIISDEYGNIDINKNHEYFSQIQGQLALTRRQRAQLVIWTPKESVIVTVEAEHFDEQIKTLKTFYFEHFIPFLLGEKYTSN